MTAPPTPTAEAQRRAPDRPARRRGTEGAVESQPGLRRAGIPISPLVAGTAALGLYTSAYVVEAIRSGTVRFVINTPSPRSQPVRDALTIRRVAIEEGVLCLTSIDTALVAAESLHPAVRDRLEDVRALGEWRTAAPASSRTLPSTARGEMHGALLSIALNPLVWSAVEPLQDAIRRRSSLARTLASAAASTPSFRSCFSRSKS